MFLKHYNKISIKIKKLVSEVSKYYLPILVKENTIKSHLYEYIFE